MSYMTPSEYYAKMPVAKLKQAVTKLKKKVKSAENYAWTDQGGAEERQDPMEMQAKGDYHIEGVRRELRTATDELRKREAA